MFNKIADGLSAMSKQAMILDDKVKRAELIRTSKRIEELKAELEMLRQQEAKLMMETGTTTITHIDGKVELA